jgi:translation initiation factor IF-1
VAARAGIIAAPPKFRTLKVNSGQFNALSGAPEVIVAKEEMLEMDGTVQEVLPNTQFRVELENGASVLAYAGGRVRQNRIRILAGDRVRLEMSPYDVTRGRINYRHKDERAPVFNPQRKPAYKKPRR